jgi:LSD1 subclass zinc finger protein
MPRRPALSSVLAAGVVLLLAAVFLGVTRLTRFVDQDPRLCAQCHRASPEFAVWSTGSHRGVACQKCHHSTPEQGLAMLRSFLAGKAPGGKEGHGKVEVGACGSCHLSHDPHWPQVGGSRGHRIHAEEKKIACVACHATGVHGFEPASASCRACHGQHAVRESGMQRLHCFACHDFLSKDASLRPTRRDCLRCHRAEGVLPARFSDDAPMQFDCGACHKPHAMPPAQEHVACASCHKGMTRAGLHARAGHGSCRDCHRAHLWRSSRDDCLRCHAGAPAHAEGRACASCHVFGGAPRALAPGRT